MAYSEADIASLKAAIATGALEVEFGAGPDRRKVRYRSLAEMKQTLADMQGAAGAVSHTVGGYCSGL